MSEPTAAALTEMGLLSRSGTIQTTIVGIGHHVIKKTYLDKFTDKNKDEPMMCNVACRQQSSTSGLQMQRKPRPARDGRQSQPAWDQAGNQHSEHLHPAQKSPR